MSNVERRIMALDGLRRNQPTENGLYYVIASGFECVMTFFLTYE